MCMITKQCSQELNVAGVKLAHNRQKTSEFLLHENGLPTQLVTISSKIK